MPSATAAPIMGSASRVRQAARCLACDAPLTGRDQSRTRERRLSSPHECADEFAVHGGDRVGAEPGAYENVARVLGGVNPRRLYVDLFKAGFGELGAVLALFECAGNAPDPQLDAAADSGGHLPTHHHVRHGEPSTWFQDAKRLR